MTNWNPKFRNVSKFKAQVLKERISWTLFYYSKLPRDSKVKFAVRGRIAIDNFIIFVSSILYSKISRRIFIYLIIRTKINKCIIIKFYITKIQSIANSAGWLLNSGVRWLSTLLSNQFDGEAHVLHAVNCRHPRHLVFYYQYRQHQVLR